MVSVNTNIASLQAQSALGGTQGEYENAIKYLNKYNKFKYYNSKILSDSIPCSFYFLKKMEDNPFQHILF